MLHWRDGDVPVGCHLLLLRPRAEVTDLAVIVVAHRSDRFLKRCLESVYGRAGGCGLELIVVNNASDQAAALVEREFPEARLIRCENHGFAHANNRALLVCDARYALLLNADTEVLQGTLRDLVDALDARPNVGIAGVVQVDASGALAPSMRRFPSAARALHDALGLERLSGWLPWHGERVLDPALYEREALCDWTSGSFLVVRRELLQSAGLLDERFFLYSEEPDLCLRAREAGWETRHLPMVTIAHYGSEIARAPRLVAQDAFSRLQFARKHFSPLHRFVYAGALGLGYAIRSAAPGGSSGAHNRRGGARLALRTLLGNGEPPFGEPPLQALTAIETGARAGL